jgi:3-oxoacyl-[acyl-carrier-protein] synthase II
VTTARLGHDDSVIGITGLGVLTPLGDDPAPLAQALLAGRRCVDAVPELGGAGESQIHGFEATRYANIRGMRMYNRMTQLGICAAKLALANSGMPAREVSGEELGVVTASTFGHLDTLIDYDRSLVTVGMQRTNPALMPLSIPSAPGAMIALSFGAKAFSITLSDGEASSLDTLGLGARLLESGRARACIVVGAFAICRELSLAASRAGMLASPDDFRVLDRRGRGTALGEAAAAMVLERLVDARARGVEPRAFVRGHASTFSGPGAEIDGALRRACEGALASARVTAAQVGLVSASANGLPKRDRSEALALLGALGDTAAQTAVIATKGNLGETLDAGGLLQSLAALSTLHSGQAPPIAQFEQPEIPGLRYIARPTPVETDCALVTSISTSGACSALVLSANREP